MSIKFLLVLCSAVALFPLGASAAGGNDVVATVDGTPITKAQFDGLMTQKSAQGMPDTPETRKMVVDNLALQVIVARMSVDKGLDKTPEVASALEQVQQSVLANAFIMDYLKTHAVSEEAIQAEYETFKSMNAGNEYKAAHILVKTEAEAAAIIARLKKNPHAFGALAKAKSQDPGSKDKGGDLGWFDAGSMVPEFSAAAGKLAVGKFTEAPVKTEYGFHVIRLDGSRPVQVPPLEEVKDSLSQRLQQAQLKTLLAEMKAKAKIELVDSALSAANAGDATKK